MEKANGVANRLCNIMSAYGIDNEKNACVLEKKVLEFCSTLGNRFTKCVSESAVLTRKKISELRKKWASELSSPVTESLVMKVLDELKFASVGGTTLADLKEDVVRTCASVSKNLDDLLTCIDEAEKLTWALSSE